MSRETVRKNAPLVEVIAEIRWKTVPLSTVPDGAIDPYFDDTLSEFEERVSERGYNYIEALYPADFPRELAAGKPFFRYRPDADRWPLFQLGPGIFTANITPPYNGWSAFQPILSFGVEALLNSHPIPDRLMKIERVHLRYVDAFTSAHGLSELDQSIGFLRDHLGVKVEMPSNFNEISKSGLEHLNLELGWQPRKPENSKFLLKTYPGTSSQKPALVAQFSITSTASQHKPELKGLMDWFDSSHDSLSSSFDLLVSSELEEKMGPVEEV